MPKQTLLRIATPLSLSILILTITLTAAGTARAQDIVRVDIPFHFAVEDQTFPPGNYSLRKAGPNLLDLRDSQNRLLARLMTRSIESREPSDTTNLKFSTVGGNYTLTQMWVENNSIGSELAPTNRARSADRERHPRAALLHTAVVNAQR